MPNALILNAMLCKRDGGVQVAFTRYARALVNLGYDVVSCTAADAAIRRQLSPTLRTVAMDGRYEYSPRSIWQAVRILNATKPAAVFTHGRRAFVTFATARYFTRLFTGHDTRLVNVLHRKYLTRLNAADHIICVSADIEQAIADSGIAPAKISRIPNFVVRNAPAGKPRAQGAKPVIGFLGRMALEKGLDLLLEALAILKRQGVPFAARIGGEGPLRHSLQAQAARLGLGDEDVAWCGWLDNTDDFYDDVDILVLPSRRETFGIVTIEAFLAGKTVIATRTSGSAELVRHGVNGLLCDISAPSIAAALADVLADPARAKALAAQSQRDAEAYTAEAVGASLNRCLAAVLAAPRRPAAVPQPGLAIHEA